MDAGRATAVRKPGRWPAYADRWHWWREQHVSICSSPHHMLPARATQLCPHNCAHTIVPNQLCPHDCAHAIVPTRSRLCPRDCAHAIAIVPTRSCPRDRAHAIVPTRSCCPRDVVHTIVPMRSCPSATHMQRSQPEERELHGQHAPLLLDDHEPERYKFFLGHRGHSPSKLHPRFPYVF